MTILKKIINEMNLYVIITQIYLLLYTHIYIEETEKEIIYLDTNLEYRNLNSKHVP